MIENTTQNVFTSLVEKVKDLDNSVWVGTSVILMPLFQRKKSQLILQTGEVTPQTDDLTQRWELTRRAVVIGVGEWCSESFKEAAPLGSVVQFGTHVDLRPQVNMSQTNVPKMVPNPNFVGFDIYPPEVTGDAQEIFTIQVSEGDISRIFKSYESPDLKDTLGKYRLG